MSDTGMPDSPHDDDVLLDGNPLTCSSEFNRGYNAGFLSGLKTPEVNTPRWDEDSVVLTNDWNTPDHCGKCGEPRPPIHEESP